MTENSDGKHLTIIDGTAFVYRAFFGLPLLSNASGQPTNAVYNFTTTLLKLLREEDPKYLAVCFDLGGRSKRDELYADYKADRPMTPDALITQFPYVRRIVDALGITTVEMEDYEADDVAGTLGRRAEVEGFEVVIMTNDKDMLQLISPKIRVHRVNRDGFQIYDAQACRARYGVEPHQIPDYLALIGDKIDGIPGVSGLGEKTVPRLLSAFGSVEDLFSRLDEVQLRWQTKLEAGRDHALLSKSLATIQTNLDLPITPEECKIGDTRSEELLVLFRELEFHSLLGQISTTREIENPETDYHMITDETGLDFLIQKLKKSKEFSVDLETTSVNAMKAHVVGIALTTSPHQAYYIPILNSLLDKPSLLPQERVLKLLRSVLEDSSCRKVGQNIKYDLKVFKRHDIELRGISFDTMVASALLHPSSSSHGLDELAFTHLNHQTIPIKDLVGTGKKQITMDYVALPLLTKYACEDVDVTIQLQRRFSPQLCKEELDGIFRDIEMPLISVLADMELRGIKVNSDYLSQLSDEFQQSLNEKMKQIYAEAREEFNINSPKQLGQILFEELGLPKKLTRKTRTGYSTDVRVLERLLPYHPLPALILEYRALAKLKSTYTDSLVELIDVDSGRIHTSFHQAVARTGRLSSSNPNLQNIPVRTAEGRKIRRAFIACNEDHTLIVADYSQIELRILAHLSGDVRLREAFERGLDVHSQSAALLFGVSPEEVDVDMRRQAKTMNYGIVYGIGPFRLAGELKIGLDEARQLIENYFETYCGAKAYFDCVIAGAQQKGYVTTLLGRRCYVPEIHGQDNNTKEFGKRVAINAPMQGTAAELIKVAMLQIHDYLTKSGLQTKMLLQVHDELVFEAPKSESEEVMAKITYLMENACQIDVPVKVDVNQGANWLEAK